jgi:hypothetical protein
MSSSNDGKTDPDSQLAELVAAAGAAAVEKAKHRKLSLDKAIETLDELIEEAKSHPTYEHPSRGHRKTTRNAMNALFDDTQDPETANPRVLVALDDADGIDEEYESKKTLDQEKAKLAGAQSADRDAAPIRHLGDRIDFWQELETLDLDESD